MGDEITQYKVFIQEITSQAYTLESNDCVGTSSTVLAYKECFINIATVLGEPWGVDGGDHIWAKVSALNSHGESP